MAERQTKVNTNSELAPPDQNNTPTTRRESTPLSTDSDIFRRVTYGWTPRALACALDVFARDGRAPEGRATLSKILPRSQLRAFMNAYNSELRRQASVAQQPSISPIPKARWGDVSEREDELGHAIRNSRKFVNPMGLRPPVGEARDFIERGYSRQKERNKQERIERAAARRAMRVEPPAQKPKRATVSLGDAALDVASVMPVLRLRGGGQSTAMVITTDAYFSESDQFDLFFNFPNGSHAFFVEAMLRVRMFPSDPSTMGVVFSSMIVRADALEMPLAPAPGEYFAASDCEFSPSVEMTVAVPLGSTVFNVRAGVRCSAPAEFILVGELVPVGDLRFAKLSRRVRRLRGGGGTSFAAFHPALKDVTIARIAEIKDVELLLGFRVSEIIASLSDKAVVEKLVAQYPQYLKFFAALAESHSLPVLAAALEDVSSNVLDAVLFHLYDNSLTLDAALSLGMTSVPDDHPLSGKIPVSIKPGVLVTPFVIKLTKSIRHVEVIDDFRIFPYIRADVFEMPAGWKSAIVKPDWKPHLGRIAQLSGAKEMLPSILKPSQKAFPITSFVFGVPPKLSPPCIASSFVEEFSQVEIPPSVPRSLPPHYALVFDATKSFLNIPASKLSIGRSQKATLQASAAARHVAPQKGSGVTEQGSSYLSVASGSSSSSSSSAPQFAAPRSPDREAGSGKTIDGYTLDQLKAQRNTCVHLISKLIPSRSRLYEPPSPEAFIRDPFTILVSALDDGSYSLGEAEYYDLPEQSNPEKEELPIQLRQRIDMATRGSGGVLCSPDPSVASDASLPSVVFEKRNVEPVEAEVAISGLDLDDTLEEEPPSGPDLFRLKATSEGYAYSGRFAPLLSCNEAVSVASVPASAILRDIAMNRTFCLLSNALEREISRAARPATQRQKKKVSEDFDAFSQAPRSPPKVTDARAAHIAAQKEAILVALAAKDLIQVERRVEAFVADNELTLLSFTLNHVNKRLRAARPLTSFAFAAQRISTLIKNFDTMSRIDPFQPIQYDTMDEDVLLVRLSPSFASASHLSVPKPYSRFATERLLLSGDIESNPGPDRIKGIKRTTPVGSTDIAQFSAANATLRLDDLATPAMLAEAFAYGDNDTSDVSVWYSSALYVRQVLLESNAQHQDTRCLIPPFCGFGVRTLGHSSAPNRADVTSGRSWISASLANSTVRDLVFTKQLAALMAGWTGMNLSVYGTYLNPRIAQNVVSDHVMATMARFGRSISPDSKYDLGHIFHKVWEMHAILWGGASRDHQFCFSGVKFANTREVAPCISQAPFGHAASTYPDTYVGAVGYNGAAGGYSLYAASDNDALLVQAFPAVAAGTVNFDIMSAGQALSSPYVGKIFDDQAFGPIHMWFWTVVFSKSFLPIPAEDPVSVNGLVWAQNGGFDINYSNSRTWCSAAAIQDDGYSRILWITSRQIAIPGFGTVNLGGNFNVWDVVRAGYLGYSMEEITTYWYSFMSKKGIATSEFLSYAYTVLPHVLFEPTIPHVVGTFHVKDGVNADVETSAHNVGDETLSLNFGFDEFNAPRVNNNENLDIRQPQNCLAQLPNGGHREPAGTQQIRLGPGQMLQRPTARAFGAQFLTHPLVGVSGTSSVSDISRPNPRYLGRSILSLAMRVEIAFAKIRSAFAAGDPIVTAAYFSDPAMLLGAWLEAGGGSNQVVLRDLLEYARFSASGAPLPGAQHSTYSRDVVISCVPAPVAAMLGVELPEAFALGQLGSERPAAIPLDPNAYRAQRTTTGMHSTALPRASVKESSTHFGPDTRSADRGFLAGEIALACAHSPRRDLPGRLRAVISPASGPHDYSFDPASETAATPPLFWSRSAIPGDLAAAVVPLCRYVTFVASGSAISARPAAGPISNRSALGFACSIADAETMDDIWLPDDPGEKQIDVLFFTHLLNRTNVVSIGNVDQARVEAEWFNKARDTGAKAIATAGGSRSLNSSSSKDPFTGSSGLSSDDTNSVAAHVSPDELDQINTLSVSHARRIAFTRLNVDAIPDLRIAFGPTWPAYFSEYFLHSYENSDFFKAEAAKLVGEFVSPVYSPEHAIRARIESGMRLAREALPTKSLFSYALGLSQDEIQVPHVYSALSRLSWKRVFHDLSVAHPSIARLFERAMFGVHQPFATMLALAYQMSPGARHVLNALLSLPEDELVAATTEGLKAYFSAWKTLSLKVGAARLGYPGPDCDLMDLSILIGYTPRPDEFSDDPVAIVRDFFTPKPKSDRYMTFLSDFVAAYVKNVLTDTAHAGDKLYTKDAHIELWTTWSTSGALFEGKASVGDYSDSRLTKNALPFLYSASQLAECFTQTAMFAKLVAKPDEKGKFRRILAVALAALFNFIFFKTRTAFMTKAARSGTSNDSIFQLGQSHRRQRRLRSGAAGFSVDFPNYDQQQAQEFEALVWHYAADFAESVGDHVSAEQARLLYTTSITKFVKLVGYTDEQVAALLPEFETLTDAELKDLSRAAVVADIAGHVIPVFWGMLSGSPSTTIANTIAGLGIWSVSLARLLVSGIPFLGLDKNTQAGDDLDTYSENPISALGAYRLISSEFTMRDPDWMYRAGVSIFLKVMATTDSLLGLLNRALIPFAQRSPSSALSYSPVSDISELNDLYDLLALRGADMKVLAKYYYRAVDSILSSFKIPTSSTARHVPLQFGGLGVRPLDWSRSLVKRARVVVPPRPPIPPASSDLPSLAAKAVSARAGYPQFAGFYLPRVESQMASGVVDYMRDPDYRQKARAAWVSFSPSPDDFVLLRRKEPTSFDLSVPLRALDEKLVDLPRPRLRPVDASALAVCESALGKSAALKRLARDGKCSPKAAFFPHYSIASSLATASFPLLVERPISALISEYLSTWLAFAIVTQARNVAASLSYDATLRYIAESTALTLADPFAHRVLASYAM